MWIWGLLSNGWSFDAVTDNQRRFTLIRSLFRLLLLVVCSAGLAWVHGLANARLQRALFAFEALFALGWFAILYRVGKAIRQEGYGFLDVLTRDAFEHASVRRLSKSIAVPKRGSGPLAVQRVEFHRWWQGAHVGWHVALVLVLVTAIHFKVGSWVSSLLGIPIRPDYTTAAEGVFILIPWILLVDRIEGLIEWFQFRDDKKKGGP